jgi:hypothetical protein
MSLTIDQLREEIRLLEQDLTDRVAEFEKYTTCKVVGVELRNADILSGRGKSYVVPTIMIGPK